MARDANYTSRTAPARAMRRAVGERITLKAPPTVTNCIKTAECFDFNLPDARPGQAKLVTNLLQRLVLAVCEPVAQDENLPLALIERLKAHGEKLALELVERLKIVFVCLDHRPSPFFSLPLALGASGAEPRARLSQAAAAGRWETKCESKVAATSDAPG